MRNCSKIGVGLVASSGSWAPSAAATSGTATPEDHETMAGVLDRVQDEEQEAQEGPRGHARGFGGEQVARARQNSRERQVRGQSRHTRSVSRQALGRESRWRLRHGRAVACGSQHQEAARAWT